MSITAKLAHFVHSTSFEEIPYEIKQIGKDCILDTLSGCLAFSKSCEIQKIVEEFMRVNADRSSAQIWGSGIHASLEDAVLINGIMGHATELDDVHKLAKTHAGAIVVPTALTVGAYLKSSGREVLRAIILGYEVALRIGIGIGASSHRLQGWHATGTCGIFGAAVAVAVLMKLSEEEIINTLGLAGTQASGLWAFIQDGASCKKFHAGKAAHGGLIATLLAKGGMTGPAYILEAEDGGLFKASSDEYDFEAVTKNVNIDWEISNVDRKPYPCCRSTHPAIDGILSLRDGCLKNIDDIEQIIVETYEVGYLQCGKILNPQSKSEAQFSTPFCCALAMIDGNVNLESFLEKKLNDNRYISLAKKVSVCACEEFSCKYPKNWGCRVTIRMKNGNEYKKLVENAKGDHENPLIRQDLEEKMNNLNRGSFTQADIKKIVSDVYSIETIKNINSLVERFG